MSTEIPAEELLPLFDSLPDVVFFIKDASGRYTHANLTLVRRLGFKSRDEVLGRCAADLFPASMGGAYAAQDRRVLDGEVIENQLEVHIFDNRAQGWCLTFKRPLRVGGEIFGVIGVSRDLGLPDARHPTYDRLRLVLDHMQLHYFEVVRVGELARLANLSVAQLERHFRRVFQLTPQQVLTKLRIDRAMHLLRGDDSVAAVGMDCGFIDQSAFSRQFKASLGMTPTDYRRLIHLAS